MKRDSNGFDLPGRNRAREILGILWSVLTLQLLWKWDYEFWFEPRYWNNRKTLLKKLKNGEVKLVSYKSDLHLEVEDFKIRMGTENYLVTAWHFPDLLFPKLTMEEMGEDQREELIGLFIYSSTMRKCNLECYKALKGLAG